MRRHGLLLLLAAALGALTLPLTAPASTPPTGKLRGLLVAPGGHPVPGTVDVWLRDDPDVPDGQSFTVPRIARVRAGRDGRFVVPIRLTPRVRLAARRNGGYVNLELSSRRGSLVAIWGTYVAVLRENGTVLPLLHGAWPRRNDRRAAVPLVVLRLRQR